MFRTYLRIASRNFSKDKFFSIINISGLAIGISVVLIISLYIIHETSFDRFHSKADRVYRMITHLEMAGNMSDYNSTFPVLAKTMEAEISEIEVAVRLSSQDGQVFKADDKVFSEDEVLFADPEFFKVFDFTLLSGSATDALVRPNQVILTPAIAQKYFGTQNWESVIGKSITIDTTLFEISGVVEEAPAASHFHYNAIASIASLPQGNDDTWANMSVQTYVLLNHGAQINTILKKVEGIFFKHISNFANYKKEGVVLEAKAQRLVDIHLYSNTQGEYESNGSITNIYIFGSVGMIVLILACVNFTNLVTARSANRAKEVGVRKVLGSGSRQLIQQFTFESIALVFIATILGLAIVELLRSTFVEISGMELPFDLLLSFPAIGILIIFVVILGIVAGSYPAFFIASFKPTEVLKGKLRSGFKSSGIRNVLVTIQFAISILLITCTLIVQDQLDFMRSKKLGFDKDNVVVIENANLITNPDAFRNSLSGISGVDKIGSAEFKPIDDYDGIPVTTELDKANRKLLNVSYIDYDFLPTLNYEIIDGRNFSPAFASDSLGIILNERAANYLFGNENAIGKKVFYNRKQGHTVIGVVKDFNFESLRNEVRPLAFFAGFNQYNLHVRLKPGDHQAVISAIQNLWVKQNPEIPFAYTFLDENYNRLFAEETKLGTLFSVFSGLALLIACLGLLGLTVYMAEQRRKEISVRKVLGASLSQIFFLMSKDFAKITIVSYLIAVPIAYFAMTQWLSDFAYRVALSPLLLVLGGCIVIVIALLTMSYQALRAGAVNPVEALKED